MRKSILIIIMMMMMMIMSGCKELSDSTTNNQTIPKENNENKKAVSLMLDDLKEVLTVQDARYGYYEEALLQTQRYINEPDSDSLKAAITSCAGSIKSIIDVKTVSSALDNDTKNILIKMDIDIIDLQVPFNMQNIDKSYKIQTLMDILYLLEREEPLDDNLIFLVEMMSKIEEVDRKTEYYGLMSLLSEASDKDTESFKNEFLPTLDTFSKDNLMWETDKESIDEKVNKLLNDFEKELDNYALFLGQQYAEEQVLKQACKDALIQNGFSESESENIILEIEKLEAEVN